MIRGALSIQLSFSVWGNHCKIYGCHVPEISTMHTIIIFEKKKQQKNK